MSSPQLQDANIFDSLTQKLVYQCFQFHQVNYVSFTFSYTLNVIDKYISCPLINDLVYQHSGIVFPSCSRRRLLSTLNNVFLQCKEHVHVTMFVDVAFICLFSQNSTLLPCCCVGLHLFWLNGWCIAPSGFMFTLQMTQHSSSPQFLFWLNTTLRPIQPQQKDTVPWESRTSRSCNKHTSWVSIGWSFKQWTFH